MKKILFAALLFAVTACGTEQKSTENHDTTVQSEVAATETYSCPMRCEGEKTYTEAGTCPVCKMNLELVAEVSKDSTDAHQH